MTRIMQSTKYSIKKEQMTEKVGWSIMTKTMYWRLIKMMFHMKSFVDKEMIHFSKYDCERSIPNLVDGLKTSLRKIIYSAFKKI